MRRPTKRRATHARRRRPTAPSKPSDERAKPRADRFAAAKAAEAAARDRYTATNALGEPAGYRELIAPFRASTPFPPEVATAWFAYYAEQFHATQHPLWAWEAFDIARQSGLPLPDFVTAYLSRVSARLHDMTRTTIPERDLPVAVYHALEFASVRGTNPFRTLTDNAHDISIALDVEMRIRQGTKPDFAFAESARDHPTHCDRSPKCATLSTSTVRRYWLDYRAKTRTHRLVEP